MPGATEVDDVAEQEKRDCPHDSEACQVEPVELLGHRVEGLGFHCIDVCDTFGCWRVIVCLIHHLCLKLY